MIHPYKRPNFAARYDGYQHHVSFTLDCDGLIVAPGWRLGSFSREEIFNVVSAMKLLSQIYSLEYYPSWIWRTADSPEIVQFKTIAVDYRTFRRRFRETITPAKREALLEDDMPKQFVQSPYMAYRAIWSAFWPDAAAEVEKGFLDALSYVQWEVESEED